MLKTTLLSTVFAAALVSPVLAADKGSTSAADGVAMTTAALAPVFTERQARVHLAHQGYLNISSLTRDGNGGWRGTAMKGGRKLIVSVAFKNAVNAN